MHQTYIIWFCCLKCYSDTFLNVPLKHIFDNYILWKFCFYIIEAQNIEMLQNASSTL